jgi:uncharacterized membrane protein required for colicin V production
MGMLKQVGAGFVDKGIGVFVGHFVGFLFATKGCHQN